MKCKNCGSEIKDTAYVCMYCGVRTDDDSPKPESVQPIVCTHCGKELDPRAYICVACGNLIKGVDKRLKKPVFLPGIVLAVLSVLCAIVYLNFNLILAAILVVIGMAISIRKGDVWSIISNCLAIAVCLVRFALSMSYLAYVL